MSSIADGTGRVQASPASERRSLPVAARVALLALAAAIPLLFAGDYQLRFLAEILIIGTAVLSLDLLVGFGGLVSLGHAVFFGGAAYAAAGPGNDYLLHLIFSIISSASSPLGWNAVSRADATVAPDESSTLQSNEPNDSSW